MTEKYNLKIVDIVKDTADAALITFEIPTKLKKEFKFVSGQYLTLHVEIDGELHTRCYSISSSTFDNNISVGVKKVIGGKVSPVLVDKVKVNDSIQISPPSGNFKLRVDENEDKEYIFFAGGSGITPIKSMISEVLHKSKKSKAILVYGNRNEESILFKSYFEAIESDRFELIHCLQNPSEGWEGEKGLLNATKCSQILKGITEETSGFHTEYRSLDKTDFYICGPGIMMEEVQKSLRSQGVDDSKINLEFFTIDLKSETKDISSQKERTITVIKDGVSNRVKVEPRETILQAAEKAKVNIPASCRMGLCSTCVCKLNQGEVDMIVDHGLTKEQKEEGYILTCQTIPLDDDVVIELGDKSVAGSKLKKSRKIALLAGIVIGILILAGFTLPGSEKFLKPGSMNTGHEDLACQDCHEPAEGSTIEQLQANLKFLMGQRDESMDFGLEDVNTKDCLACHTRKNDRHPTHRFKEPRFKDAREAMHPEMCESCHLEHNDVRVFIEDLTYCQHCHEDLDIKDDPIDISHVTLAKNGQWETCLQCHDFHGNHDYVTPLQMKDTISLQLIDMYSKGGEDPFGDVKKYVARKERKDKKTN